MEDSRGALVTMFSPPRSVTDSAGGPEMWYEKKVRYRSAYSQSRAESDPFLGMRFVEGETALNGKRKVCECLERGQSCVWAAVCALRPE